MDSAALDILRRLVTVRTELGDDAYRQACHAARCAIGREVLTVATTRACRPSTPLIRSSTQEAVNQYPNE